MRVLVVAATGAEIAPLIETLEAHSGAWSTEEDNGTVELAGNDLQFTIEGNTYEILITGVGMVATAYALGRQLAANTYDIVLNLGIAGSFDRSIELGEVVEVIEDTFAELGAEDDADFISLKQLGFGDITFHPSRHPFLNIKQVGAITVNKVHGNEASIEKTLSRIQPQLESMEGAAVFYACKQAEVNCVQIRAVSNYVEKRNRDAWKIGLAVKNLNTFAGNVISRLNVKS
ncbi:futalosine hydrolase [Mucilaginibacter sp. KACC 22063]|uniref:futalosine hydrolase n=1 Tax=Mucilaginibacter sp. KACC 22063 TaxID=3025666 RepID=UPI0023669C19|nr:futalosine hydrolase [Mucilaginibacter sp. KACC 22063]WDF56075.1 futalosine hydrolase [Mucilaginibacter sp. KACC 22063]